jgi:RND family efflux transporter MFP subunit
MNAQQYTAPQFNWRKIAYFSVVVCIALLGATEGFTQEKKKKKRKKNRIVVVDKVRKEPLSQTTPIIGRFVARRGGIVAARTGGPVKQLSVDIGDRVELGSLIGLLDTNSLKWRYRVASAEVTEAKAQVRTAKVRAKLLSQELKRLENLRKSAAFSQARYEDKQVNVSRARSQVAEAKANLERRIANKELVYVDLEHASIRAPYSGVVTRRHTEIGSYVKEGDPVVTLVDADSLEIEADVPSKRIAGLSTGLKISANLNAKVKFETNVRAIVPSENPLARTRTVRFSTKFKGDKLSLAANQSVTLHIPIAKLRDILTVHKDGILNRQGKNMVFVVEEKRANVYEVTLGEAIGNRFEVLKGIEEKDLVVIRGNERLKDGKRVKVERAAVN